MEHSRNRVKRWWLLVVLGLGLIVALTYERPIIASIIEPAECVVSKVQSGRIKGGEFHGSLLPAFSGGGRPGLG